MSAEQGEKQVGEELFLRDGYDLLEEAAIRVSCAAMVPPEDNEQHRIVWESVVHDFLCHLSARREERIPDEHRERVLQAVWGAVMAAWAPGSPEEIGSNPEIHWSSHAVCFFLCQLGEAEFERRLKNTGLVFSYRGLNRTEPIVGSSRWVSAQRADFRRDFTSGLLGLSGE